MALNVTFFVNGQFGQIGKNYFFHKKNYELDFLDSYIVGKL